MKSLNIDDKDLVIIAGLIIAVVALFQTPVDTSLAQSVVTGLFGIAVGRKPNNK
jgi:uncharacterized protein (DUF697 family)